MTTRPREMRDDAPAGTVHDWIVRFATSEVAEFATRHLDELVWRHPRGDNLVDDWFACLHETLEARAQAGALGVDVRLAIPLQDSETLDRHVPSWENLGAELRLVEPPSLYLSRPPDLFLLEFPEEFRAAMPAPSQRWSSYYVCARDEHGAALGWEFSRTVWIHPETS